MNNLDRMEAGAGRPDWGAGDGEQALRLVEEDRVCDRIADPRRWAGQARRPPADPLQYRRVVTAGVGTAIRGVLLRHQQDKSATGMG